MIAPVHIARLWDAGLMAVLAMACALACYANWGMAEGFAGPVPGLTEVAPVAPLRNTETDPDMGTFLPRQIRDLGRDQARAYNIAAPLEPLNPAPPAFHAEWLSPPELERATDCMATAIYYEAASESLTGQLAVAQVILNRLRHPRYPKTVCAVIHQGGERVTGCQFTFVCDGALSRPPDPARLQRARLVAQAALHGATSAQAGQATHYHTIWIVPLWAAALHKVAIIGNHVFYRPPGTYPGYATPDTPAAPVLTAAQPMENAPSPNTSAVEAHRALLAEVSPKLTLAAMKVDINQLPVPAMTDPAMAPMVATTTSGAISHKEEGNVRFGQARRKHGSIPLTGNQ